MSEFIYRGVFCNNYYKINFPHGATYSLLRVTFVVNLKHAFKGDEVI